MVAPKSRKALKPRAHSKPPVRKALEEILDMDGDVTFELVKGSHWGELWCSNGCCIIPVDSTPRVPARHARDLLAEARKCPRDAGDVRNKTR